MSWKVRTLFCEHEHVDVDIGSDKSGIESESFEDALEGHPNQTQMID